MPNTTEHAAQGQAFDASDIIEGVYATDSMKVAKIRGQSKQERQERREKSRRHSKTPKVRPERKDRSEGQEGEEETGYDSDSAVYGGEQQLNDNGHQDTEPPSDETDDILGEIYADDSMKRMKGAAARKQNRTNNGKGSNLVSLNEDMSAKHLSYGLNHSFGLDSERLDCMHFTPRAG